jgi:hypothetical protein
MEAGIERASTLRGIGGLRPPFLGLKNADAKRRLSLRASRLRVTVVLFRGWYAFGGLLRMT